MFVVPPLKMVKDAISLYKSFIKKGRSDILKSLHPLQAIANLFGVKEFLSYGPLYNFMADNFCGVEAGGFLCQNLIFTICGFNEAAMNVVSLSLSAYVVLSDC